MGTRAEESGLREPRKQVTFSRVKVTDFTVLVYEPIMASRNCKGGAWDIQLQGGSFSDMQL